MYSDLSEFTRFRFDLPAIFYASSASSFPKSLNTTSHVASPCSACNKLLFLFMPFLFIVEIKFGNALIQVTIDGYPFIKSSTTGSWGDEDGPLKRPGPPLRIAADLDNSEITNFRMEEISCRHNWIDNSVQPSCG